MSLANGKVTFKGDVYDALVDSKGGVLYTNPEKLLADLTNTPTAEVEPTKENPLKDECAKSDMDLLKGLFSNNVKLSINDK